ncbi:MAG: sigma-54-dependent Fis family transcriptional regulator, partial [Victivallales bacterium]|nr:sigma-54-dependent Fis family transcriptional regulator [Victivallales bacterium]
VEALKLGAVDYLEKPIDLDELLCAVRDSLKIGHHQPPDELDSIPKDLLRGIICESASMRSIFLNAWRVAKSDATVLLTGESGTGKEVVASFIHKSGKRNKTPMVALNCAAIPATVLASELFGHRRGAFTGAISDREGIFLAADKGTLFLDEIGDMPLELQPSLLRAIETGYISPVGSDKEKKVDLRLIAATNANLADAVKNGKFRKDLYYRLNVVAFELPPLRERQEDIIPMAHFFLSRHSGRQKRFSQATSQLLQSYPWLGNARELANAVERASIVSNTDIILPEHLPPAVANSQTHHITPSHEHEPETISQMELNTIIKALRKVEGNRTRAAQILGISRRALLYKIKRFGITQ